MSPARPSTLRRLSALALGGLLATPAVAAPLKLLVFPSPGLFDVGADGSISGPGGALLVKIGKVSQVAFVAESLPAPRAWAAIQAQPQSCIVGVVRTPDREAHFQWVGLVSRADFVVYGREDQPAPPAAAATLDALRGQPVVAIRDTTNAAQLREHGVVATEVSSALTALRMLQARRVDYWYSHQLVAEPAARASGGPPIKRLFSTARIDGYLACNTEVPVDITERLRQGLLRLRRQGDLAAFGLN
ncbi:substrate-binding periplasmic protein [Roseateles cellulosilyticus]|uniref:Transporter substrate-binding domain-containing protein n=1 Tax=Pelomonas cellulosilytica TaxID=2906762 RepID=A0ABS8XRX9_9BURK|nr:transporter substrate-binding domain-containing protein [Pelomonas sp. P8]MCE4553498.1 transporter substrate-binding domain-containing protein [Pelomonas sp. P8]